MKKFISACLLLGLLLPGFSLAAQKTSTGTVLSLTASGMYFSGSSGIKYYADIAAARLVRKNGTAAQFADFRVGDKIEVSGEFWQDGSISAGMIRDMTLYAHTGTLSGKVVSIEPGANTFVMRTSDGDRVVAVSGLTSYKKNSSSSTFGALEPGQNVTVKGAWERRDQPFAAFSVQTKIRMVNITVTGTLFMRTDTALTLVSGGTVYGVDVSKAKIQNRKGKAIPLSDLNTGDEIRVVGKHPSGGLQITASSAKDLSLPK